LDLELLCPSIHHCAVIDTVTEDFIDASALETCLVLKVTWHLSLLGENMTERRSRRTKKERKQNMIRRKSRKIDVTLMCPLSFGSSDGEIDNTLKVEYKIKREKKLQTCTECHVGVNAAGIPTSS
jgi:hypothetical protein